jgi:outer membrane protein OmpA-like peptidoglycan-associated protein
MTSLPRMMAAVTCAGLLAVLVGCGRPAAGPADCPTTPVPGVAIAVGARANSPAPDLPAEVFALFDAAVAQEQGITLVRVDGAPTVACVMRFHSEAGNAVAREDDERRFRDRVRAAIAATRAHAPEADPLAALGVAAAAAGQDGTVVLVDSGLQTVPPLNFGADDLLDQVVAIGPAAVVGKLRDAAALPDLGGAAVTLVGIGYPAEPQPRLDEARRATLVELWEHIVDEAGARSVTVLGAANTGDAVPDVPEVTLVPVPPVDNIDLGCDTTSVLHDAGPVGFEPNRTEFVDPAAARDALREFADWLVDNPTGRAVVTGTIAHYGADEPGRGLALDRAEAVTAALVRLDARPEQVSAVGGGWGPYPARDAQPDPHSDLLNRRVVIELVCDG